MTRIAVVTGANRGIGFETCRQLAGPDCHVILTSRDEAKGQQATALLLRGKNSSLSFGSLRLSIGVDDMVTNPANITGKQVRK